MSIGVYLCITTTRSQNPESLIKQKEELSEACKHDMY